MREETFGFLGRKHERNTVTRYFRTKKCKAVQQETRFFAFSENFAISAAT